jgi:hypothetical protein
VRGAARKYLFSTLKKGAEFTGIIAGASAEGRKGAMMSASWSMIVERTAAHKSVAHE